MQTGREQILWLSILGLNRAGEIANLLTIRETKDGKKNLAGISTLASRIVVEADAVEVQDVLRDAGL